MGITLKELLEKHPEYADLHLVIYRSDGNIDYVGAAGCVYPSKDYEHIIPETKKWDKLPDNVLVFAAN